MTIEYWTCPTCRRNNAGGKTKCRCGTPKREYTIRDERIVPVEKTPQKPRKPRQTGKSTDFATAQEREAAGKPKFVSTMRGKNKEKSGDGA